MTPIEDGFDVAVASQDITQIQNVVAMALTVPVNSVNVTVRRLGGSYGGKISLPNHVSFALKGDFTDLVRRWQLLQQWLPTR